MKDHPVFFSSNPVKNCTQMGKSTKSTFKWKRTTLKKFTIEYVRSTTHQELNVGNITVVIDPIWTILGISNSNNNNNNNNNDKVSSNQSINQFISNKWNKSTADKIKILSATWSSINEDVFWFWYCSFILMAQIWPAVKGRFLGSTTSITSKTWPTIKTTN